MTEEIMIEEAEEIIRGYIQKIRQENNERLARYLEELQEKFLQEYAELAKTVEMINNVKKLDPNLYEGRSGKRKAAEVNRILEREKKV